MALQITISILALAGLFNIASAEEEISPAEKEKLKQIILAHGVMACLAWVVLAPVGAVLLRSFKGTTATYIHGIWQILTYSVYTVAVGLGIWMALTIDRLDGHHPVIGLIIFAIASFQPLGGILAHLMFKKHGQPTIVGTIHAYNGVFLITLGMINGGLGIMYNAEHTTRAEAIAYGVITAAIWIGFMAFVVMTRAKRTKALKEQMLTSGAGSPTLHMDSKKFSV